MVAWFAPFLTSVWWHIGKYEIKNIFSKSFKSLYFWLGIWVQGPYFDGKNTPHSLSMFITTSELCGFGIGFGIGRKYRPITVSVSVSGRNQNGGFGRSLVWAHWLYRSYYARKMRAQYWNHFWYQMSNRHLWQLKKSKSWGPFWSYQLNSTANSAHLAHFMR